MYLEGRKCIMFYYNNALHYELTKDTMKTGKVLKVGDLENHTGRAIYMIRSMDIIFIFTSPLPRAHSSIQNVWLNPNFNSSGVFSGSSSA